jgi:hypothetical protein
VQGGESFELDFRLTTGRVRVRVRGEVSAEGGVPSIDACSERRTSM